jgi:oligopeptide transport system substrate-binding protein
MTEQQPSSRDPMSRAAVRQILWLGAAGTAAFAGLMVALAWASTLTGGGAAAGRAFDLEAKTITHFLDDEPPQLDSTRTSDTISGQILTHVMDGLLRYGPEGTVVAAMAERWDIRPDGATFWLREDGRWSDGRPVTANDFVFAWRTVVDPATASQYAFILYYVRNAEAINGGKMPVDQLGVRAVSDRVLEVEFERPVAFFDKLVAFPTYFPIREDFHRSRGGRYAADAEDLLYNGPFTLTRWVHGASMRLEKNPHYWNRDAVRLNAIDIPYITQDPGAVVNLFKNGSVAWTRLGSEQFEDAMKLRWKMGRYGDGSIWYLDFNYRAGRVTRNFHLRKALQLVTDPDEIVNRVIAIPGYLPARSLFPAWLQGVNGPFRQEYPPPAVRLDLAQAREHLSIAKRELGVEQIPPLVVLMDDTPLATREAEYLQSVYRRTLGLEIRIDKQIFKQRIAKHNAGEFDIVMMGWGPDYADPLTFGDLYASWNGNNRSLYSNPALDAQVKIAQSSIDQPTRMKAFAEIQRIMIDDAVHLLTHERGRVYVQVPQLKGVVHRAIGTETDFTYAYLVDTP